MDTDEQEKGQKSKKKAFGIKSVNSYGTTDIDSVNGYGNEVHLSSRFLSHSITK